MPGNRVRLLCDADENYPAWLDAIRSAERSIHFESYIVYDDEVGREFADAFAERARAGARVRVLYDWLGAAGKSTRRLWRSMTEAGVEVRCFNPPRLESPLGWLSRDHRKTLTVDGRAGFVTGLCVGRQWVGDPGRNVEPWRDTGVELHGPALAALEEAFAEVWALAGDPIPASGLTPRASIASAGDVALRVVASTPYTAGLYRLDQLIAALARRTLWITDAYFVGTTLYVQALRAAALDGVDVRLLVPGSGDIALLRPISRSGYRPLLEAGVRVFEWDGPMLHAKTAVADGRWGRVGSTNLNVASWLGNWEMDIAVEDEGFAREMERTYLDDLGHATEIVLTERRRVRRAEAPRPRVARAPGSGGSASRMTAGALRIGNTVGAAIANRRPLGPAEARVMGAAGVLALGLALVAALWPRAVAVPTALIGLWAGLAMLLQAHRLHGRARAGERPRDDARPQSARPSGRPGASTVSPDRPGAGPPV